MARSATLNVMIKAAEKAARNLKRDFGEVENLLVSRKGPGDFVSIADKKAEEILMEELNKARPDFAFLGEEGGQSGNAQAESRWIVDPLDGTTNFLHGIPHWAISIAWELAGEIQAGLVYDPIKDEMFFGERGAGAFLNSRRLRVSSRKTSTDALACTGIYGFAADAIPTWQKQINGMRGQIGGLRILGSGALDLCYVAAGRSEIFWENLLKPWDFAAGRLFVTEAGGQVTRIDGSTLTQDSGSILATNGVLHRFAVKALNDDATSVKKVAG